MASSVPKAARNHFGVTFNLARLLRGVEIRALDDELGRRAGMLLARTKTTDVIDSAVALLAVDGDDILTSDAEDIAALVAATGAQVEIVDV